MLLPLFLLFLTCFTLCSSLEATWTPADASDEPLPLSQTYRDSLSKLDSTITQSTNPTVTLETLATGQGITSDELSSLLAKNRRASSRASPSAASFPIRLPNLLPFFAALFSRRATPVLLILLLLAVPALLLRPRPTHVYSLKPLNTRKLSKLLQPALSASPPSCASSHSSTHAFAATPSTAAINALLTSKHFTSYCPAFSIHAPRNTRHCTLTHKHRFLPFYQSDVLHISSTDTTVTLSTLESHPAPYRLTVAITPTSTVAKLHSTSRKYPSATLPSALTKSITTSLNLLTMCETSHQAGATQLRETESTNENERKAKRGRQIKEMEEMSNTRVRRRHTKPNGGAKR